MSELGEQLAKLQALRSIYEHSQSQEERLAAKQQFLREILDMKKMVGAREKRA